MQQNEGPIDRIIRAIIAAAIAAASYYLLSGVLEIIGYVISIIMLVTAATGFCGIYKIFGINTNRSKSNGLVNNRISSDSQQKKSTQPEIKNPNSTV